MEDDDDAFLYGDDSASAAPSSTDIKAESGTKEHSITDVPNVPTTDGQPNGQGVKPPAIQDGEKEQDDDGSVEDDEEDDDDDDDEDSESDIEFIIDASQEGQQPAQRPGYQRPGVPVQNQNALQRPQSTITSEYTPLSRAQLLPSANPALAQAVGAAAAAIVASSSSPIKPDAGQPVATREGGPPAVPLTAPKLNLSPAPEDRAYPQPEDQVEADEVQSQDIFDIDIDALPEKPWRRYGADLSDYFNYGFNEESWNTWRGKKEHMTDARKQAEMQSFVNPMMPNNMQHMMAMMPPPQQMQAMQAMMAQQGGNMGMMPPDQMMAMMAGMSGMPPSMNPAMMPGMFGGQRPNGMGGFAGDQQQAPYHSQQNQQQTPLHQQRGQSEAPSENGRDADRRDERDRSSTPRPGDHSQDSQASKKPKQEPKDEERDSQLQDKPLAAPPMNLPMKPMSDADMSAFFGASGIDMSQVAAAGLKVADNASPNPASATTAPNSAADISTSKSPVPSAATTKGASIRGRAAAVGTTSSKGKAVSPTLPANVPSGPKNPGKRYNDRDTGSGGGDALDYGAHAEGGDGERDDRGRDRSDGRDRHDGRSRPWDDDVGSRDRTRDRDSREGSTWETASHRDDRYSRHRNDDRTPRSRKESHYESQDRGSGRDDGESSSGRRVSSSRPKWDDYDDETASQSSAGGRRRRPPAASSRDYRDERSHRSDRPRDYRDREHSSRDTDRDRDRDREREREREKERERERETRNQLRADRRAGKDIDDHASSTSGTGISIKGSRKRAAPEEQEDQASSDKGSSARRAPVSRKKR